MDSDKINGLVCEICFENYDLIKRKPYSLVPCSHEFCYTCLSQLSRKVCPYCNTPFQQMMQNRGLSNLLPKPVECELYKKLVDSVKEKEKSFENILKRKTDELNGIKENLSKYRTTIAKRSEDLINQILNEQTELMNEIDSVEKTLKYDYRNYDRSKLKSNEKIKYWSKKLEQDDIKYDQTELSKLKTNIDEDLISNEIGLDFIELIIESNLNSLYSKLMQKNNYKDLVIVKNDKEAQNEVIITEMPIEKRKIKRAKRTVSTTYNSSNQNESTSAKSISKTNSGALYTVDEQLSFQLSTFNSDFNNNYDYLFSSNTPDNKNTVINTSNNAETNHLTSFNSNLNNNFSFSNYMSSANMNNGAATNQESTLGTTQQQLQASNFVDYNTWESYWSQLQSNQSNLN